MGKRYFSDKVVEWYLHNKRELPWRASKNPYFIWLSEIILQQTRVTQGLPYYLRFTQQYPTVHALANAPERDVLRLWQGLGYYTRARNLHKCAKTVSSKLDGKFPERFDELRELPGIGDYTAAAVASICFNQRVAVVDGNVFRVLSRIYGIDTPINTPAGKKEFTELAGTLVPQEASGDYNQALMEFGATLCTPKNPSCHECIFSKTCVALKNSLQPHLPVKLQKKASRKRYFDYLVFRRGKSLMMRRRSEKDIWFGLYDFPLIESNSQTDTKKLADIPPAFKKLIAQSEPSVSQTYKHVLTHQTIFCRFIIVNTPATMVLQEKNGKFYSFAKIEQLPKPVLISRFLNEYSF
jgi:A/G-specific adenine glycosylase